MGRTAFILGAGFSAAAGFPLAYGLGERIIDFIETDRHSMHAVFLTPGQGYSNGQFYEGLKLADPRSELAFEELLIKLVSDCEHARDDDPRHTTLRVLRSGCARLLWKIQNEIDSVPACYENFAIRFFKDSAARGNSVVTLNWDLIMEKALSHAMTPWQYTRSSGAVSILKPHGSINWSSFLANNGCCDYVGWNRIAPQSKFSYDASHPLQNPDVDEIHPDFRPMLFPGDPELPEKECNLKLIWHEVEKALDMSETLVFIGYSFPDYDSYAREIFQRYSTRKLIEVYNPSEAYLERSKEILGRHTQLFTKKFEDCPYAQV